MSAKDAADKKGEVSGPRFHFVSFIPSFQVKVSGVSVVLFVYSYLLYHSHNEGNSLGGPHVGHHVDRRKMAAGPEGS